LSIIDKAFTATVEGLLIKTTFSPPTDPKMHITATFHDHKGKAIHSKYGHPEKTGERHHICTGQLPKEYEDAKQKHKEHLKNNPDARKKHEKKVAASKVAKQAKDKERAEKKKEEDAAFKAKAEKARKSGTSKSHDLAGNAEAHAANCQAAKAAKKARKVTRMDKAHKT